MLIPAYVYLRCEKCGADHGRQRLPFSEQQPPGSCFNHGYERGKYHLLFYEGRGSVCKACGDGRVQSFFETDEFRGE